MTEKQELQVILSK
jgi:hypothetical protein